MDHLHRELAPISKEAWEEIDREAKRTLSRTLAGRRLVDFSGPRGWDFSLVGTGRSHSIAGPSQEVKARVREARPLVEYLVPFTMPRDELEAIARGAKDADLEPIIEAARSAAHAEDDTIFEGLKSAGIPGMLELGKAHGLKLSQDYEKYPSVVASALTFLRHRGIEGPYAIALGPRCFQGLTETTNKGGYPILDLVRQQLDGRIVWAPAIDGAVVLSTRGGDFELVVGQDFAVGYERSDGNSVELYLQETLTFLTYTPEAAVPLRYETRKRG
jgi:uncharacterized linocin/CFP29 family protein